MYMTEKELSVLHKLGKCAEEKSVCELSADESELLKLIISQYTKIQWKEFNYETKGKTVI